MLCPSAQPDMEGSVVLGVVGGTPESPRVGWLERPVPATSEVLALAGPVKPTQVFRFAAQCDEGACRHFDGARCQLATRIVQILPAVTESLPPCQVRAECRWWKQEGRSACRRCPQVVTEAAVRSEEMIFAALGSPITPSVAPLVDRR